MKKRGIAALEYLHAIVVPDEVFFKEAAEDEIRKAIKDKFEELGKNLPGHKHITGFTVIKEKLPRTVLGKIKRYEIQNKFLPIILKEDKRKNADLSEEEKVLLESDIGKKVVACAREALDIKTPINLNDSIELDLGADSLGIIELVTAIEKCFNVEIDEEMVKNGISTLKDLILKVKEKIHE